MILFTFGWTTNGKIKVLRYDFGGWRRTSWYEYSTIEEAIADTPILQRLPLGIELISEVTTAKERKVLAETHEAMRRVTPE